MRSLFPYKLDNHATRLYLCLSTLLPCMLLHRRDGWLPLHLAANVGRTACVDALLAREGAGMLGAPNEAPGIRCGWTPLHCAAKQGRVAMVRVGVGRPKCYV